MRPIDLGQELISQPLSLGLSGSWSQGSCPFALRGAGLSAPVPLPLQSLITFVNKHLNKLNLEVTELETQVSVFWVGGL